MDFKFSHKSLELQEKMNKFFEEHIFPNEEAYEKAILDSGDPLHIPALLDELKEKARKEDLWNLFLPDSEHGAGLTNVDYAPLACLLYTSPSPRDIPLSRMPSSA